MRIWTISLLCICLAAAGCTTFAGEEGPVPSEAIVVPILSAPILIDGVISPGEWEGAWQSSGAFVIPGEGIPAGTFPFQLQVAGDARALYLSVEIDGLESLNYSDAVMFGEVLEFLFSPDRPDLSPPADRIICAIFYREGRSSCSDYYWTGEEWAIQSNTTGTSHFQQGRPYDGRWGKGSPGPTGSLVWEQRMDRQTSYPEWDGFHPQGSETFRFALKLARPDPSQYGDVRPPPYDEYSDVHPGEGHTPENARDPATWWRFRFPS